MSDKENRIPTGTAAGLLDFLDFLVAKGYATGAAVTPWKSATSRVFKVVEKGKEFGAIDVRSLNEAEYLGRFATLAKGELKEESIAAYRKRFERAVLAYRDYLENSRVPSSRRRGRVKAAADPAPSTSAANATPGDANGNGAPKVDVSSLIDFPFPLRSGQIVQLRLPTRLEKADAERIAAFVRTLAFDPMLELPAPAEEAA
jgi:hypothetical protein